VISVTVAAIEVAFNLLTLCQRVSLMSDPLVDSSTRLERLLRQIIIETDPARCGELELKFGALRENEDVPQRTSLNKKRWTDVIRITDVRGSITQHQYISKAVEGGAA